MSLEAMKHDPGVICQNPLEAFKMLKTLAFGILAIISSVVREG